MPSRKTLGWADGGAPSFEPKDRLPAEIDCVASADVNRTRPLSIARLPDPAHLRLDHEVAAGAKHRVADDLGHTGERQVVRHIELAEQRERGRDRDRAARRIALAVQHDVAVGAGQARDRSSPPRDADVCAARRALIE